MPGMALDDVLAMLFTWFGGSLHKQPFSTLTEDSTDITSLGFYAFAVSCQSNASGAILQMP